MENALLKSIIQTIIENIEVWDNSLFYLFSDCLGKLVENIINKIKLKPDYNTYSNEIFHNIIINMIIKFYMDIIENNETDMTIYYIRGFNDIIETLSKYKKVILEHEIIDKASIMGSFGKKNTLRKYSLFFCTSLIRVNFFIEEIILNK